ncbi:MAG TPA: alcohol dehydrogenase catalytic domain-containing protein [Phycisphaerae bacterium]|nr:alcohol dehydrogenase catalytic domain-containing protein [Phycisphaerae bacterium]
MTVIDDYRNVAGSYTTPKTSRAWNLYGAGLENLRLEAMPVPTPRDDQLLVRIDAVGICASDWKMISQGAAHARMKGRDLAKEPTVPGHEVSMTVVGLGKALAGKYQVGERYSVQAEIYIQGENVAYGYKLRGADQQYQTIGPEIYAQGYLLRVDPALGYAQAALAEPWACVYHAYSNHRPTQTVKPGGTVWYVGAGPLGLMHIEKGIQDGAARVVVSEMKADRLEKVRRSLGPLAEKKGVELVVVDLTQQPIDSVLAKGGADDIIVLAPVAKAAEGALEYLAKNGYFNMFAGFESRDRAWMRLNLNDMHYGQWTLVATSGSPIEALRRALDDAAAGKIDPHNSVACVGGIDAVHNAIHHTHEGTYPGRIVVYPQIEMPLTPVDQIVADGRWTNQAEEALLAEHLGA